MEFPKIVVTGLGAVTALGHSMSETFDNLCAGKSGINEIPWLREAGFPVYIGAEVKGMESLFEVYPQAEKHNSRKLAYALKAMDEACQQAGLESFQGLRAGIFMGVETSRIPFSSSFDIFNLCGREKGRVDYRLFGEKCRNLISRDHIQNKFPFFLPGFLAGTHAISGPVLATSNACASSNYATGEALRHLRSGLVDVAVVGSSDEMIDEYMITGFSLLRALSQNNSDPQGSSRPFDMKRDGFVLGEGGAILILETLEHALKRGAKPICELAGYGSSSDGEKITACNRQGAWLMRAMECAIEDGGMTLSQIGYVNAHGTSTRLNDLSEAMAIHSLFGESENPPLVNSSKSMLGHTVAAAGAIEAAVTITSMVRKVFHPNRNLSQSDTRFPLNYCGLKAVEGNVLGALSNSCGFSGGNSCIAFRVLDDSNNYPSGDLS
ncbi:MAG: hypothetical protein CVV64_10175 [Candidatus Wallbacteria bacterium HGW-Wallbacteria-1]|jgi:3-oxoacyl-[acyl-carrier-protein] synthase II|uniref:Ketosynthase family 3 (KS3) domain-containing protein n=1 Tax=Candidatus Wallbacteria bacterium HGW-Wallbacteria-1 TaxID=2013854 RepID=A0A2N1PPR4_9BACT|nr:MAG: hypothetical protein CVV64_10175 [Candidatus Wallbacteria bacterium HGW-Wallbacteria-1]